MKPGRTLAPTAAPVRIGDLIASAVEAVAAGRSVERLERELKAYLEAQDVVFLATGKAALCVALQALHAIRPARKVLMPAYTCFTVAASVIGAGLQPVLIDVDPVTLDFDDVSLKRAFDQQDILCIVPTHLFGVPVNMDRVRAQAARADALVLEDAAQGLGVTASDGRRLGTMGDVSVISLGRGKHLTGGGGGLIAARSSRIAQECRRLHRQLPNATAIRSLRVWVELAVTTALIDPRLYWLPSGLPFLGLGETAYEPDIRLTRLPATCAGALRGWPARLEQDNRARGTTSDRWADELGVARPAPAGTPLLRFPLLLDSTEGRAALLQRGGRRLGISTMYPYAVHRIPQLRGRFEGQAFPGADTLASRLVTLPTHRFVTSGDRAAVRQLLSDTNAHTVPIRRGAALSQC